MALSSNSRVLDFRGVTMYRTEKHCFIWYSNELFLFSVTFNASRYDVVWTTSKLPLRTKNDVVSAFLAEYPLASVNGLKLANNDLENAFSISTLQFKSDYAAFASKFCNGTTPAVPGEPIKI